MTGGVSFELVLWEDFIDVMSQTRPQDEYNKTIRDCDLLARGKPVENRKTGKPENGKTGDRPRFRGNQSFLNRPKLAHSGTSAARGLLRPSRGDARSVGA